MTVIEWADSNSATVTGLYSRERNKGHATALMQKIVEWADANNMTLILDVLRFGHPIGPDNAYLIRFYEKFGFEVHNPRARIKTMFRSSQELQGL